MEEKGGKEVRMEKNRGRGRRPMVVMSITGYVKPCSATAGCVTLGRLLNISEFQFLNL